MGKLLIVTGMSGAGKTIALKSLEDMGFYCVDNLPISLVEQFAVLVSEREEEAALGIDIRSGRDLPLLSSIFLQWKKKGSIDFSILFLDCRDEVLLKRYKETRRAHPLSRDGRIETGIRAERRALEWLKDSADHIIDTSYLLTRELRGQLHDIYVKDQNYEDLQVTILSFGFKYGIPEDCDLLYDVRFLPNPYYVSELKQETGKNPLVRDYVMSDGAAAVFLEKLTDMLAFLLPRYIREGKNQLVVGVGCTGGKHRSVTIAELLYQGMKKSGSYGLRLEHRDMEK